EVRLPLAEALGHVSEAGARDGGSEPLDLGPSEEELRAPAPDAHAAPEHLRRHELALAQPFDAHPERVRAAAAARELVERALHPARRLGRRTGESEETGGGRESHGARS